MHIIIIIIIIAYATFNFAATVKLLQLQSVTVQVVLQDF